MATTIKPGRCPMCGVNGVLANPEGSVAKCTRCGGFYDPGDDGDVEGGTYCDDPSMRMQKEEERRARAAERARNRKAR